jgi:hypothetical protein
LQIFLIPFGRESLTSYAACCAATVARRDAASCAQRVRHVVPQAVQTAAQEDHQKENSCQDIVAL